jgi:hypothetical protein
MSVLAHPKSERHKPARNRGFTRTDLLQTVSRNSGASNMPELENAGTAFAVPYPEGF